MQLPISKQTLMVIVIVVVLFASGYTLLYSGFNLSQEFDNALRSESRAGAMQQKTKETRSVEPSTTKEASLTLSPHEGTYFQGVKNKTTLNLRASSVEVAGVDIVLQYDPQILTIVDIIPHPLMHYIPLKDINPDEGIIRFSLLIAPGHFVEGDKELATIEWEATGEGVVSMKFDYSAGMTNETNVAEFGTGRDALTSVVNATYIIE